MNLSVNICSYDSASRIIPTLEHLAKQELNGLDCELILVDNNSKDDAINIAYLILKTLTSPFNREIVKENRPGKTHALKTGILASSDEVLIICDDDNWLKKITLGKHLIY
jgi:glycosyltransferase involved in cell wall biosynthesis